MRPRLPRWDCVWGEPISNDWSLHYGQYSFLNRRQLSFQRSLWDKLGPLVSLHHSSVSPSVQSCFPHLLLDVLSAFCNKLTAQKYLLWSLFPGNLPEDGKATAKFQVRNDEGVKQRACVQVVHKRKIPEIFKM